MGGLSSQVPERGSYFHTSQLQDSATGMLKDGAIPHPRGSTPSPLTPLWVRSFVSRKHHVSNGRSFGQRRPLQVTQFGEGCHTAFHLRVFGELTP